jgi:hypothetical protein
VEDTNLNTSSLKILNLLFDCKSYLVACLKPVRQKNIIYHILFVAKQCFKLFLSILKQIGKRNKPRLVVPDK